MFTLPTLQTFSTVALVLAFVVCLVVLAAQLYARHLAPANVAELPAAEEDRPVAPSLRLVVSRRRRTECPYDWAVQGL